MKEDEYHWLNLKERKEIETESLIVITIIFKAA